MADMLYRCVGRAACSRAGRPGPFSAVTRHVQLEHSSGRVDAVLDLDDAYLTTSLSGKPGRPGSASSGNAGDTSDSSGVSPATPPERPSDDNRALFEPPDPVELARRKPPGKPTPLGRRRAEPVNIDELAQVRPARQRPPLSPETREALARARERIAAARAAQAERISTGEKGPTT